MQVFKERNFTFYWIGQFVSSIGDSFVPIAVTFAILKLTGSAVDMGIVLGALWGGKILFLLWGGVWSDRLPRTHVMIASDLIRAVLHLWIGIAFLTDTIQVWYLIVAAAVYGVASSFFFSCCYWTNETYRIC